MESIAVLVIVLAAVAYFCRKAAAKATLSRSQCEGCHFHGGCGGCKR